MGYYRSGHATVNADWPNAFGVCDKCGFVYNLKDLLWQTAWRGPQLQTTKFLVCQSCLDKPNEQLRTVTITADPIPIDFPRPEPYITEISTLPAGTTPNPDPNDPELAAPTNSSALDALTTPVPPNQEDPVPAAATATPPSSYFTIVQDL